MIDKITKDEIIEFYNAYIHPSSPSRTKLSILMHSQIKQERKTEFTVEENNNGKLKEGTIVIEDIGAFKRGLEKAKPPVPIIPLEPERIG
jgi:hypothetical protein